MALEIFLLPHNFKEQKLKIRKRVLIPGISYFEGNISLKRMKIN